MEIQDVVEQENNKDLVLELQAEVFLREGRKWSKFLAILGFIFVGFGVVVALIMFIASGFSSDASPVPIAAIAFVYLLIIGVYFFPIYYLLQFANKAKEALDLRNTQSLTESFKYLKSHYKFIGIMTIVMMALYPIIGIIAVILGFSQTL